MGVATDPRIESIPDNESRRPFSGSKTGGLVDDVDGPLVEAATLDAGASSVRSVTGVGMALCS